ncbi:MAG: hypothetical protein JRG76_10315 [Deltaproteobacteria bacterium]|nr:hypothetical protein [Deltaproteobacteria bacterium]MBW2414890.1 hypothetical protein [Deltaproteobacteria bacterium]
MRRILLVALLPALSGCLYVSASGSFGARLESGAEARIVPGETTRAQVLELLGPPEEFLRSELTDSMGDEETRISGAISVGNRAHDAFTYQHDWVAARGTWPILYGILRTRVESDLLVIFFDEQERVREVSSRSVEDGR